ncbi:hypothetical protein AB0E69_04535 [Kribbella sp. NPDC026611]|uniref:hypothetical protein n=1 Tax=Kribbella sp. NPDC026611 TaxID=3154911 RepID=UPI00340AEDCE
MKSLWVLRVVAVVHAVAICLQPVFMGIYLDGTPAGLGMHETTGLSLVFVGLTQLLVATVWWRSGGRVAGPLVSLIVTTAEVFQAVFGYSRSLAIHIPLGITLVGTTIGFALWTTRQRPTPKRRTKKRRTKEEAVTA